MSISYSIYHHRKTTCTCSRYNRNIISILLVLSRPVGRSVCHVVQVDTENIGILVESESTCTKEALDNVVKEVSRMEREELHEREREGGGRSAAWPRQKYHFTLIRCVRR